MNFGSCLDSIIEGEFPVLDEAIFDIILLTLLFLRQKFTYKIYLKYM